ncbi:EF-hand domain-containing protein [Actinomadura sp. ATCC 31491]|uniref:EF-hand domain-containing protein n=1 Tax=Actinomadura luzonensis TaxID=2805427 RepID=A0ABT0FT26_9ACTN|nr:EF-hand domain-containing protein [Actinomadura luzonensis]MCK2215485.1 EF-hand domain-containing protein [Actinomadura luzonensis]
MNAFYLDKMSKIIQLLDDNGDGVLTLDDFYAAADRVALAFGHAHGSSEHHLIRDAYTTIWDKTYAPMDSDRDNVLTFDELVEAHQDTLYDPGIGYERFRPLAQAFLALADGDGDGIISREEFVRTMRHAFRLPEDEAHEAFGSLDETGGGRLTYDQIHRAASGFFCTDDPDAYGAGLFGPVVPVRA